MSKCKDCGGSGRILRVSKPDALPSERFAIAEQCECRKIGSKFGYLAVWADRLSHTEIRQLLENIVAEATDLCGLSNEDVASREPTKEEAQAMQAQYYSPENQKLMQLVEADHASEPKVYFHTKAGKIVGLTEGWLKG